MHQRKIKNDETRKNSKGFGRTHRDKERLQYQIGEEANPHPKSQKQKGETHQHKTRDRNVFAEFFENVYEGEEGDEEKKNVSVH